MHGFVDFAFARGAHVVNFCSGAIGQWDLINVLLKYDYLLCYFFAICFKEKLKFLNEISR